MMRCLIVLCLLFSVIGVAAAQEPAAEVWNWAWREATGELIAYSSSGAVNTLLSSGTVSVLKAWRLSDDHAIAVIQVDGEIAFYDLTSQSAQPYVFNFDAQSLEVPLDVRYSYFLEDYSPPYLVFAPEAAQTSPPDDPAILVNLATREIDLLSNDVPWFVCCRFSQDGQYLRYVVGSGESDTETLVLRERVLATGEEHDLFTRTGDGESIFLYPDLYGERWLLSAQVVASRMNTYNVLHADGTQEQIYQQSPSETYTRYEFLGDDMLAYQPLCQVDCVLHLWTIGGDTLEFMLPSVPSGNGINPIWRFDEHLIAARSSEYLLLSTNEPTFIGYHFPSGSHLPSDLSPDRRWLLVADTDTHPATQGRVWDLMTRQIVVEFSTDLEDPLYFMVYDAEGFIVHALNAGTGIMYRFADQTTYQLSNQRHGSYFDILPDGSVLYQSSSDPDLYSIYRYSPDDESFLLLIEDVNRVQIEDVNYYAYP